MSEAAPRPDEARSASTLDRGRSSLVGRRATGFILPVALLLLWEGVVRAGVVAPNLLPPPSGLIGTFRELAAGGDLGRHLLSSIVRVVIGFVAGASLAVILGAAVGLSQRMEALVGPTFQAVRAIPSLAWVPLLLFWLGIDEASKIVLIAIGAFFPVYGNLVSGIHNVDRKLVEFGRVCGLGDAALVCRIFIPAALPSLFVGLRSGLSLAWMFLVAAELIAATSGVGYLLSDGRETGRADVVITAILLLALLGKLSDSLLAWAETRLLAWRDVYATAP